MSDSSSKFFLLLLAILAVLISSCKAFAFLPMKTTASHRQRITSAWVRLNAGSPLEDLRQLSRTIRPSVALVVPVGVRNSTARGSGFVVEYENGSSNQTVLHLLTAAHVAAPGYRLLVSFPELEESHLQKLEYTGEVLGRDVSKDLALLRIESTPSEPFSNQIQPLLISHGAAEIGTPVFSFGYPSGGVVGAAMTNGIVCASAQGLVTRPTSDSMRNITNSSDTTRYVVTNAAMAGGMSGGPLVDDNGRVVGVNALINMELRALGNYAVGALEIQSFLSKVMSDYNNNDRDKSYRLWLYNDRFNKRERVSKILQEVVKLSEEEANEVMMEAHTKGRGLIGEFVNQEEAQTLSIALQREDLLIDFEKASE